MSKTACHPDRQEVVHLNWSPSAGKEMAQPHWGVVLTRRDYNRKAGLCLVVPITSTILHDPFYVHLPGKILPDLPEPGTIRCDQVKACDYRERGFTYAGRLPADIFDQVVQRVLELVDPTD